MPKFFKEVMTHLPTIAMRSVDWKGILGELGPMAGRLGKKTLDRETFGKLESVQIEGVQFERSGVTENFSSQNSEDKKSAGEKVLELYFSQLGNPAGLALDLRPKHFQLRSRFLLFCPNNFWYQFNEKFRQALVDLYKGFYTDDEALYDSALSRTGLTKDLSPADTNHLKALFKDHFGPGEQREVLFELESFKESFYELFKFFVDKKVELGKDFIFLGAYLVGLYTTLEKIGEPLDARESLQKGAALALREPRRRRALIIKAFDFASYKLCSLFIYITPAYAAAFKEERF